MTSMSQARVLLVVPTLGRRPELLERTMSSIADQSVPADVVIVAPDGDEIRATAARFGAAFIVDPGSQTKAINAGGRTGPAAKNTSIENRIVFLADGRRTICFAPLEWDWGGARAVREHFES